MDAHKGANISVLETKFENMCSKYINLVKKAVDSSLTNMIKELKLCVDSAVQEMKRNEISLSSRLNNYA